MNIIYEDFAKLLIALLLGAIIGAEREYRNKSAGFRTITLICVSSTLFTMLSFKIGGANDQARIAANIITGIGFLGAGAIFRDENRINGLTTATTIWVASAIGMTVGGGYYLLAIISTLACLMVLYIFIRLQSRIDEANQIRKYKIACTFQKETLQHYELLFKKHHLTSQRDKQSIIDKVITGTWIVQGSAKNHDKLVKELLNDPDIK